MPTRCGHPNQDPSTESVWRVLRHKAAPREKRRVKRIHESFVHSFILNLSRVGDNAPATVWVDPDETRPKAVSVSLMTLTNL